MKEKVKAYWRESRRDWGFIFRCELRDVLRDEGVLVFFFLVPLFYPLLYSFIYTRETVREVPVAVVDTDNTTLSRKYVRDVDATPDVHITKRASDMVEAEAWMRSREVNGIIYIPPTFSDDVNEGRQTSVSIYADMSSLLYYKALLMANTNVSLEMNARVKVAHAAGATPRQEEVAEHPIRYEEVSLYNPQNGFASFLIPAVLILIIQQTLLLGVGISAGTARERGTFPSAACSGRRIRGMLRFVLAKGTVYLLIYIPLSVYLLFIVPRLFSLSTIGNPVDIMLFIVPFILACTFFAMTVSVLVRQRETCIMLIVFSSLPLLFISGVSWPGVSVPDFWKIVSYLFPSTPGINGFLQLGNMAASLNDVMSEWHLLWGQALFYFLTTCFLYRQHAR